MCQYLLMCHSLMPPQPHLSPPSRGYWPYSGVVRWEYVFTPAVVVLLKLCDAKLVCTHTKEHRGRQGKPSSGLRGSQTLSGPLPGLSWGTFSPVVQVWCPSWGVNGSGSPEHLSDWGRSLPRDMHAGGEHFRVAQDLLWHVCVRKQRQGKGWIWVISGGTSMGK